jgi:hypothetical protein
MKHEVTLCDLCESPVANGRNKLRTVDGAGILMYQSVGCGGWGSRKDVINFSGEVCERCFSEFQVIIKAVEQWLQKRNGARTPSIIITEHNVSTVSTDESSPEGHRTSLLRQL